MSTEEKKPCAVVSKAALKSKSLADERSESPIQPESEALEPWEDASCPSPSSLWHADADVSCSDTCSLQGQAGSSTAAGVVTQAMVEEVPNAAAGVVTRAMVEEVPNAATGVVTQAMVEEVPNAATGVVTQAMVEEVPNAATGVVTQAMVEEVPNATTGVVTQAMVEEVPNAATGVVTQAMIEEEKALRQQSETEDTQKRKEREQEWMLLEAEDKAERFERLKQLLHRSNMYTEYLISRMQRQQEEISRKQERRARKMAKLQQQQASSSSKSPETTVTTHNLRQKRLAGQSEDTAVASKAPAAKRRRTAKGEDVQSVEQTDESPVASPGPANVATAEEVMEGGEGRQYNGEARLYNGEAIPDGQPLLMTGGILRPYQLEGYMWLRTLFENGMNGILADEMGLGKTVQCVAMLSHMVFMGVPGPFLICAPLSTISNWYSEFQRFAPKVPVLLYHGDREERKVLRNKIWRKENIREGVKVMSVVITSYEVAMMDQRFLQHHEWRYMVVDEGHRIKNTHCRLIRALRLLKTTNRLLLTGTPLQNNMAELWSLLNFLLPEIFDDLGSFEAWFDIEHIDSAMAADEQKKDVLSMLHQILTPFMLRRLKTDVDLRIPPKKEVIVYAPLRPLQKDFYSALIDRTILKKIQEKNAEENIPEASSNGRPVRRAAQKKVDYSLMLASDKEDKDYLRSRHKAKDEEDLESWVQALVKMQQARETTKAETEQKVSQLTIKLRNIMMQLRKCCSHPFLLEHPLDPRTKELCLDERIVSESGKMLVLDRMLKELYRRGHKVLIFSQMTKMLDLIEDFCVLRKYAYCRLDGAMNIHDRHENMAEYQKADSDKFVFLLSTRAGGLGITLTAADTVIIYDSDWNPQCDLQAQDRCHRIGQTRPVIVYRLVTANSIDQRIVERAAAKRKLEKLVIHQGKFKSGIKNFKTSLEPISSEELLELLNSKDHESVWGGNSQDLITDADLDLLLDRSDLEATWKRKQAMAVKEKNPFTEEDSEGPSALRKTGHCSTENSQDAPLRKTGLRSTENSQDAPLRKIGHRSSDNSQDAALRKNGHRSSDDSQDAPLRKTGHRSSDNSQDAQCASENKHTKRLGKRVRNSSTLLAKPLLFKVIEIDDGTDIDDRTPFKQDRQSSEASDGL